MRQERGEEDDDVEAYADGGATASNNNSVREGAAKSEAEIKRDRKWKNENKAKIAHHNRKDLAMKKNSFF